MCHSVTSLALHWIFNFDKLFFSSCFRKNKFTICINGYTNIIYIYPPYSRNRTYGDFQFQTSNILLIPHGKSTMSPTFILMVFRFPDLSIVTTSFLGALTLFLFYRWTKAHNMWLYVDTGINATMKIWTRWQ